MSKRNGRIVTANKPIEIETVTLRKCAHHIYSPQYGFNMKKHDDVMAEAKPLLHTTDMQTSINIKIAFHFLAPAGSFNRDRVSSRVHDVILSLNDDFNNYSPNPNTMNNLKYRSVINQVFVNHPEKQRTYLSPEYLKYVPTAPSNTVFELGEIYYYPNVTRLRLSRYNDIDEVDLQHQVIKQYICQHHAIAIEPEHFLNIWIVDMLDTSIMGFSSFPWENMDYYHGIVIHRRCFFPEENQNTSSNSQSQSPPYSLFKTFTHQVGHYLGLLHVCGKNSNMGSYGAFNINIGDGPDDEEPTVPTKLNISYDPTNRTIPLHQDPTHNPLFMNFMDYTIDKYVSTFTPNQIQKMRYMIFRYRPQLNSIIHNRQMKRPRYNPDTDTVSSNINTTNHLRQRIQTVPAYHNVENARQRAHQNQSISDLIPNLTSNNNPSCDNTTSQDQILANIIKNMPPTTTIDPVRNQQIFDYQNLVNQNIQYNSAEGYATHYPYDQYNNQQYLDQLNLYHKIQSQPDNSIQSIPSYPEPVACPEVNQSYPRAKRVDPQIQQMEYPSDISKRIDRVNSQLAGLKEDIRATATTATTATTAPRNRFSRTKPVFVNKRD